MPLDLKTLFVTSVSAQVGRNQLDAGLIAAAIGLLLVVVYAFLYYRGLGIVSVCSLLIGGTITYLAVVLLPCPNFTLELAGIAGLIVAIGITADSFVVFFERLRDEVREGKQLRPAVESGWKRARRTILVSDTVSFLAALLLYYFAIGEVKGFAYTLGLTTLIDIVVVFLFHQADGDLAGPDEVLRQRPPDVRPQPGPARRQDAVALLGPPQPGQAAGLIPRARSTASRNSGGS